jgi:hypothetical protein
MRVYKRAREQDTWQLPIVYHRKDVALLSTGLIEFSRTHTHPSHSETSHLLTSSLSLGVPVPRATLCM